MAKPNQEIPGLDLIEEGVHLLRQAPRLLLSYYLGAIPFILGLLFFWADMSRSAYAASRCAAFAFVLTLLFIWMKCWQAVFARALWRQAGGQAEPWTPRRAARLCATQAVIQPWGAILFLPALLLTVPFPWTYAYFQNVTVFGFDDREGLRAVHRRARIQAVAWSRQNASLLLELAFFSFFVFLNILVTLLAIPFALKVFLGMQSRFTQSPMAFVFNTTTLATACALTYLCIDPLVKAIYVLRCFYGESRKTGEALWADLTRLQKTGGLLLLALALGLAPPAAHGRAAAPAAAEAAPAVSPAELDQSIQETLHSPRYTWRMPRELPAGEKQEQRSMITSFLDSVVKGTEDCVKGFFRWIDRVLNRLFKSSSSPGGNNAPASPDYSTLAALMATLTQTLIYLLLVVLIVTVGILIWRIVQQNRRQLIQPLLDPTTQPVAPDLNDEQLVADQLPTDGWLLLAQQLIDRGELRLALRALYLASLAALAQASLIRIRRSKSNLDYVRELRRRAHAWPGLLEVFAGSVSTFDRAWYGLHEVTLEGVQDFTANYQRIRALVG